MKNLAIIGTGDLGQQIAYHSVNDHHYKVVGFFDDFKPIGLIVNEFPILGGKADIQRLFDLGVFDVLMVGIGYKHFNQRASFFETFKKTIPFATIIHSSAYVDSSCKIGKGVIIYPGCVLDMNVVIEDNVLLNTGCTIAHDSSIGCNSFLSPAVKIAGFVKVGKSVSLGIGTTVIDNLCIGEKVRTGAGAVVVNNLIEAGLYIGLPAKMKFV
jgi:sugar O-acyltransferase (sialic acid O-acetyltransferase NeuD family)